MRNVERGIAAHIYIYAKFQIAGKYFDLNCESAYTYNPKITRPGDYTHTVKRIHD